MPELFVPPDAGITLRTPTSSAARSTETSIFFVSFVTFVV